MAHEARTDWSMTLGAFFLLIVGAGQWAVRRPPVLPPLMPLWALP